MALAAAVAGCGTPGAPQPPSLNLPERVVDLAARRTGSQVSLTFTMPKRNTDKLLLKGSIAVRVCRRQGAGACETAGAVAYFAPGAKGSLVETLPAPLGTGSARLLTFFVELKNSKGRSAGFSNGAVVLAGSPPDRVADLRLTVRKDGVVLNWTPDRSNAAVRLRRILLSPPKENSKGGKNALAPEPEPVEQNLLVDNGAALGRALDNTVRFGEAYEYRAQRVLRVTADNETLELDGDLSAPVRADVLDVFPPEAPTGLAAVATAPNLEGVAVQSGPSIDLSWRPNIEADLAGYIVYRRENGSEWQRISPPAPLVGPAFHDPRVAAGHTYTYAVSAIDAGGHESAKSAEAEETVPRQ